MADKNKVIFVGATDTGVGKTLISALLVDFLRRRGLDAGYQKWAATGCEEGLPEDLATVLAMAGEGRRTGGAVLAGRGPQSPVQQPITLPDSELELAVPYRFRLPASPHLAAEQEGREIEPARLLSLFEQARAAHEVLVVEGVGGMLVPLTRQLLLIDLVAQLKLPTLLVARSGLGTINHSLLSLEAMRHRQIPVPGLVFSDEEENPPEIIVNDNPRTIAEFGQTTIFGRLPRCLDQAAARAAFSPIGEAIFKHLTL
ncbi:dethiobiotin synthase [Desulfurivibrio alkaliphilus]|uniref:ATP-dependent dethiobiotin synthetase BioD n=1 Tax=Desulfurivibrio alkaliphilus (strain DSM 19089 / UNIQEM U267 / AHT2) TaxID=589865 RepID=D6Z6C8_DESAT|nr:dethiobiotin synthase [Desulfurivibrio alkaliphilus]ADH86893.1 dethiobiotin synthase [Desulfurivibrio alkaliphilus AHT 2]